MDIKKFMQAFRGSDLGYGTYISSESNGNGKVDGKALTARGKPTKEQWEDHLNGKEPGLGIIPIDENNNCYWGCIDIDEYPLNHKEISQKIKKLPLIMFRSKSGGAHLILFSQKPVKAKTMRKTLTNIASNLGFSSSEIFPKQDYILLDRGDLGNFLNLPFHNAENSTRYAFKENGAAATLQEFLDLYDSKVIKNGDITNIKIDIQNELIPNGPPCLQLLCSQGFPKGGRNEGLFSLGVYARKAFPDTWRNKVEEYNRKYMNPPLDYKEITTVMQSLNKKDYGYKCSMPPIKQFCNHNLCRTRKYGIGPGNTPRFTDLNKLMTEPPLWRINVDGQRIQCTTYELLHVNEIKIKCADQIDVRFKMTQGIWEGILDELWDNLSFEEAPPEAGTTGVFMDLLEDFCTSFGLAVTKDEIRLGKPYTENGKTFFRLKDLERFFKHNEFKTLTRPAIVALLNDIGAFHTKLRTTNKKEVRVYRIEAFDKESDIPERKSVKKKDPF